MAHQIYKGCSSWIKKAGTSDSATNAEKRFKYEKEKRPERIFNFQNTFDRTCNEIRMEIQTVNIFGSLIPTKLIEIIFWYKEKSYETNKKNKKLSSVTFL
jgi:hypothetical protein